MQNAIPFTKMHGLGNDFVFVAEEDLAVNPRGRAILADLEHAGPRLARAICDRHFGIGADGLIVARRSKRADCQVGWMYFNSDGSISLMCGNGVRCLALWAVRQGFIAGGDFSVDTAVGPVHIRYDGPESITTDLGEPKLASELIPVAGPPRERVIREELSVGDKNLVATCVSMGNPHCVIFNSGLSENEARKAAPLIQEDAFFPHSVNVEFVETKDRGHADVFVWERGCGPTLACATGAAAVLVAGVMEGVLDRRAAITLPGGTLKVHWDENTNRVSITGPAAVSYSGHFDPDHFLRGANK